MKSPWPGNTHLSATLVEHASAMLANDLKRVKHMPLAFRFYYLQWYCIIIGHNVYNSKEGITIGLDTNALKRLCQEHCLCT
ncbi:hypothetical protein GDO78_001767 [Eleutherodactylus coqui]|uniref:Uncharacterized protein n=1 Tax=Eleutherodactylus coqui TaxID=57060 RepID=A0A8J6FU24_ELECQ|nr:hypothetical protein GDO78_001767 [Eleutherodactylus coqui]